MLPTSCPGLVVSFFFGKLISYISIHIKVSLYFHSRTWEVNHTLSCCFIVANNVDNDSYVARNALHAGNTIGISATASSSQMHNQVVLVPPAI